jgi:hypothetical protein
MKCQLANPCRQSTQEKPQCDHVQIHPIPQQTLRLRSCISDHQRPRRSTHPDKDFAQAINDQAKLMAGIDPWEGHPEISQPPHPVHSFQQHPSPLSNLPPNSTKPIRRPALVWLSRETGALSRRRNMDTQSAQIQVTRELVPADRRLALTDSSSACTSR